MTFGWRTVLRAKSWLIDLCLQLIGVVDHRRYMRMFNRVMASRGMDISGTPRYVSPRAVIDATDYSLIHLGDGVVISSGVRILTHDFSIDRVMRSSDAEGEEAVLIAPVHIGDRCFVGAGSILLPGTRLEDNVIVGAGSVVRGIVEAGQVVIGNPARPVTTSIEFGEKNRSRAKYV